MMYCDSSHHKAWIFPTSISLQKIRDGIHSASNTEILTPPKIMFLLHHFETKLKILCGRFHPAVPPAVAAVAVIFFKRFYLRRSIMEYHPDDILIVCLYLACKVEEHIVMMKDFLSNIKNRDREQTRAMLLTFEPIVMEALRFHLEVWVPTKALDGALLALKCLIDNHSHMKKVEDNSQWFIDQALSCDAPLLYTPSQIAFAAVFYGVKQAHLKTECLKELIGPEEHYQILSDYASKIHELLIEKQRLFSKHSPELKSILDFLDESRCPQNNPSTEEFKKFHLVIDADEDELVPY